jgi:hypothetical protein
MLSLSLNWDIERKTTDVVPLLYLRLSLQLLIVEVVSACGEIKTLRYILA